MKHYLTTIALVTATCVPVSVSAEHEVDHRYTLRGYVLDEQRQPIAGQRVSVAGHGSATTDASGEYTLRLHLHNEDLGTRLTLRTGNLESKIRVSFDPSDKSTPRVHYANYVGGEYVSGELSGMGFPLWGYAAAGLGMLTAGGLLLGAKRRRKSRRTPPPPPAHPRKRRKPRSKGKKRNR